MMETSPLLNACIEGCKDTVLRLLQICPADIDKVGSATVKRRIIKGVNPLYCASAAGHLDLTKTLLAHGAHVNATIERNNTPLLAACTRGYLEIAKCLVQNGADIEISDREGHTCLMMACFKERYDLVKYLLQLGASVNRKSLTGKTAIHYSATSGNVKIFEELLKHGAEFHSNFRGITPILRAALNGHVSIVNYIIENCLCTQLEIVNALQLVGAYFLDQKRDIDSAFKFWERAINLRNANSESPLEEPSARSHFACYFDATEVSTLHQLRGLVSDTNEMRLQSLLIRERILGPVHKTTIDFIYKQGIKYIENGDIKKGILFYMYVLTMQLKAQSPLSRESRKAFLNFHDLIVSLIPQRHHIADFSNITLMQILRAFQKSVKEIKRVMKLRLNEDFNNIEKFEEFVVFSLNSVHLMYELETDFNETVRGDLNDYLYKLIKLDPKVRYGWSLLHLACSGITRIQNNGSSLPYKKVIKILLNLGASPDARDFNGNTPLHISAMTHPFEEDVFKTLLQYNAHLDVCNNERQTPYQLAQQASQLDVCPLQYINLKCLCAKVIRRYNIPYEDFLNRDLKEIVNTH